MLVTSDMIWQKMEAIDKKLDAILDKEVEHSVEEVSLFRAAKLLKLGNPSVLRLVKLGHLKARTYKDVHRTTRYRFRVADIRAFQKEKTYDHISLHADDFDSAEEIAKRIFKNNGED